MTLPPTGSTGPTKPGRELLKRIDIGLLTGAIAVLVAFMSLLVARAQTKMAQDTQKASVLPIVDIDMGYIRKLDEKGAMRRYFEVTLNNVGAGIAHIQSVTPTQNGKALTEYQVFEDAIMTRRMRMWATLSDGPSTGYLRAGENITPRSYKFGASEGEVDAYLRGQWGTPMDKLDLAVCYCSVFKDCWSVNYLDRKAPKPTRSCGVTDVSDDTFQNYIDEVMAARIAKNKKDDEVSEE